MDKSRNRPSPSGARLSGDDYQHLFTWLNALKLLLKEDGVIKVSFEVKAGNVDDLVIHRSNAPSVYNQIKFAMTQRKPLTHKWFTTPSRPGALTPLQRFYDSMKTLTINGVPPEMALQTNRWPAAEDPLLKHVCGRSGKVVPRLAEATPKSASGKVRAEWAEHLKVGEGELIQMLEHLEIRAGREALDQLHVQCTWLMLAVGFRGDPEAVDIGVSEIRRLIGKGIRELDADDLMEIAHSKRLLGSKNRATLLIQSLESDPWPEAATAYIDWVDLFEGSDASSRRQLRRPDEWNTQMKPDLHTAVTKIKRQQYRDVFLAGTMRLSTGLMAGAQLSEVAGFSVSICGREGEWSSYSEKINMEVIREEIKVGAGREIAMALSVSAQIHDDVLDYVHSAKLPIDHLIVYSPSSGISRQSIPGPKEGLALAHEISAMMRTDTRKVDGMVHFFQAGPLPLSVMVGHLWNRMPLTQLYDDLGPGRGYAPTFLMER